MRINNIRWVKGLGLGAIVMVWGCGGGVSERRVLKEVGRKEVEWKLKSRSVKSNTFTRDSLLDRSYDMDYFLVRGNETASYSYEAPL